MKQALRRSAKPVPPRQAHHHAIRMSEAASIVVAGRRRRSMHEGRRRQRALQSGPELCDADPLGGQHAILQAIEVPAVQRRHEAARGQAQEDAQR